MYKLSSLPIEILYLIGSFLETEDLVTVGRLNTWYGYWISIILGERIEDCVQKEGWRIHIDILSKSYPLHDNNNPSFPFATELLLLSEYSKINPFTLTLEFNLCPIDEDGLDAIKSASSMERSIALFDKIKTNIDIVAYFAQISTNRRLQHVNQAGAAIMNDRSVWKLLLKEDKNDSITSNMAIMGSAFKLNYQVTKTINQDTSTLIEKFKKDYDQHTRTLVDNNLSLKEENPVILSFDKIRVSPEWWVKQMKVPTQSSNILEEPQQPFSEHGYW